MPIYQYRCTACGHEFEVIQAMQDPPVSGCERCGQAVTKIISPSGLVFKGSGWYVTDYGSRKPSESPAEAGKKTETDKKTEAAPADGSTAEKAKPAPPEAPAKEPKKPPKNPKETPPAS